MTYTNSNETTSLKTQCSRRETDKKKMSFYILQSIELLCIVCGLDKLYIMSTENTTDLTSTPDSYKVLNKVYNEPLMLFQCRQNKEISKTNEYKKQYRKYCIIKCYWCELKIMDLNSGNGNRGYVYILTIEQFRIKTMLSALYVHNTV